MHNKAFTIQIFGMGGVGLRRSDAITVGYSDAYHYCSVYSHAINYTVTKGVIFKGVFIYDNACEIP